MFSTSELLQIAVHVGGMIVIYTSIKTDIAVIKTQLRYIEQRLKIVSLDADD